MKIPWFQLLKYFKYNFVFKFNDNNIKKSSFMHYATKCSPFCSYQSGLVLTQKCLHTQRRKKPAPFVWQFKTNQIVNYSKRPQSDDFVPSVRKLNHCHATYHYMLLFLTQSLLLHVLKLTTHIVSLCVCVCERERQKKTKTKCIHMLLSGFQMSACLYPRICLVFCVCVCVYLPPTPPQHTTNHRKSGRERRGGHHGAVNLMTSQAPRWLAAARGWKVYKPAGSPTFSSIITVKQTQEIN